MTTRINTIPVTITKSSTALDNDLVEPTTGSLAFGSQEFPATVSVGTSSMAIGPNALSNGTGTTSNNIAIGFTSRAYNVVNAYTNAIGIGANNLARDRWHFAMGYGTRGRHDTIALGGKAKNNASLLQRSTIIGYGATARWYNSCVGYKANAQAQGHWVMGAYATSPTGTANCVVLGSNSNAGFRNGQIIVGHNCSTTGDANSLTSNNGVLFGLSATHSSIANSLHSIAIGHLASTSAANQLVINLSGTSTMTFASLLSVSTAGTGVQANPNTTQKVLAVRLGTTDYVIQLYDP